MDITLSPTRLVGEITAIASKSQAHRLLICAAFADSETTLICPDTNEDIEATAGCLNALGASIVRTKEGYIVTPIKETPKTAVLNCRESGSTLRFLLPIVGALGVEATFLMAGRLPSRPLSPLKEVLERMGCTITRPTETTLLCTGKLTAGSYTIDGSVSSQYITGLLFALVLMNKDCSLHVVGKVESRPYIEMTKVALSLFGAKWEGEHIFPSMPFRSPKSLSVEGDWSNGAFWLAANALDSELKILGLSETSVQGDRVCKEILENTHKKLEISAADIPDLVPILSVVAAAKNGGVFTDISRLRLKESDRVASVIAMLDALGAKAYADKNTLTVLPAKLHGGVVDSVHDHRIAMSAAIAATVTDGAVTILGAECVNKSYPSFWEHYQNLGGHYEQYLR